MTRAPFYACPPLHAADPAMGTMNTLLVVLLIVVIVGAAASAFSCGRRSTGLGLTGTAYGWAILIFGLLLPPVGVPLALLFLAAGRCSVAETWR